MCACSASDGSSEESSSRHTNVCLGRLPPDHFCAVSKFSPGSARSFHLHTPTPYRKNCSPILRRDAVTATSPPRPTRSTRPVPTSRNQLHSLSSPSAPNADSSWNQSPRQSVIVAENPQAVLPSVLCRGRGRC